MRTLLASLFLLLHANLSAQFIGTRYGTGTPDFMNACGQLLWHDVNVYALGTQNVGGHFGYMTVRRNWCWTDQLFSHIVMLGGSAANVPLPASVTNTHDSFLLTSGDVVAFGTLDQTGVQYVYPQPIPSNPALVGITLYSQWVLYWVDVAGIARIMLSQGLSVTIWP